MKLPWRETPILYGEDAIRLTKERIIKTVSDARRERRNV